MAKRKTKKLNIKKLAERLNEVRNGEEKHKEPPPCTCEPVSNGCHCGRFQWEMARKNNNPIVGSKIIAEPKIGDYFVVNRPRETEADYGKVPFRVWSICEGKHVRVDAVEKDGDIWWCWCDTSHITKQGGDEHWFPSDGLLKTR